MAFSINTNLDAMSSMLALNTTNNQLSTSLQRLSSGLRINSAADDPAGMVRANSLQAQVDSLSQAVSNMQDAQNMVKTASSALGQINSLVSTIRTNALQAANTGASDPVSIQANQASINAAVQAINNIASSTSFGTKKLLNGSAGISAAVTNSTAVGGIAIGGSFASAIASAGNITITVNNAATRATEAGTVVYASVNATVGSGGATSGGVISINGSSVNVRATDTIQTVINNINSLTSSTGVSASFSGSTVVLSQTDYGSNYKINLSESANILISTASASVSGSNATVTVQATTSDGITTSVSTAVFSGGRGANDSGLRVTDTQGNSILLTEAGNTTATANANVGNLSGNSLQFQIGGNTGQTASIAINSAFASNLGNTSVAGQSLQTIDVTSQTGANNAITMANEASAQISKSMAQLGAFQADTLGTSMEAISTEETNITASISSVQDADLAQEMINLTRAQLLQSSGVQILSLANQTPSTYLRLLSGISMR